jgi:hypothetical protein
MMYWWPNSLHFFGLPETKLTPIFHKGLCANRGNRVGNSPSDPKTHITSAETARNITFHLTRERRHPT